VEEGIAKPILIGNGDKIRAKIKEMGIEMPEVPVIDTETSPLSERYAQELYSLRQRKGVTENEARRLEQAHLFLKKLIQTHQPNVMSVEELFFAANAKTALTVGQARGVILLTSALANLKIFSYTPLQVKQALSGYGRADKHQMQMMVKAILNLKEIPQPDDAADALAIAITHAFSYKLQTKSK
jgi:crossover junction endodeoxyribonuclease RuvC